MRLFFYGTLLDGDVQAAVLGRPLADRDLMPAVLRHFRRVYIAGRCYPMVVPHRGGLVEGAVAERLSPDDLARIAAYEGSDYRLERHQVFAGDAAQSFPSPPPVARAVWLYRCRASARPSTREWHLAAWQVAEKSVYLRDMAVREGAAGLGRRP